MLVYRLSTSRGDGRPYLIEPEYTDEELPMPTEDEYLCFKEWDRLQP